MPTVRDHQLSETSLQELLCAPFTYAEVGATAGEMPNGYRHLERQIFVGVGPASFDAVSRLLLSWEMHRLSGLAVSASHTSVIEGTVGTLRLGVGVLSVRAPVRVVRVVDEPRRRGFAYGTLPGHPESGEEFFLVEHNADDLVFLTIRAFSRPVSRLARLGGPITPAVQSWMTNRYLRSASRWSKHSSALPPQG
jgi:uncharacterized protein (UPF0548 family)